MVEPGGYRALGLEQLAQPPMLLHPRFARFQVAAELDDLERDLALEMRVVCEIHGRGRTPPQRTDDFESPDPGRFGFVFGHYALMAALSI